MTKRIVNQKANLFATRILNLYKYLTDKKREYIISNQIARSGTSVGANLSEAEFASSRKDFIAKNKIALREINETKFWLEQLFATGYLTKEQFDSIYADADEIKKIMYNIMRTLNISDQT